MRVRDDVEMAGLVAGNTAIRGEERAELVAARSRSPRRYLGTRNLLQPLVTPTEIPQKQRGTGKETRHVLEATHGGAPTSRWTRAP